MVFQPYAEVVGVPKVSLRPTAAVVHEFVNAVLLVTGVENGPVGVHIERQRREFLLRRDGVEIEEQIGRDQVFDGIRNKRVPRQGNRSIAVGLIDVGVNAVSGGAAALFVGGDDVKSAIDDASFAGAAGIGADGIDRVAVLSFGSL